MYDFHSVRDAEIGGASLIRFGFIFFLPCPTPLYWHFSYTLVELNILSFIRAMQAWRTLNIQREKAKHKFGLISVAGKRNG